MMNMTFQAGLTCLPFLGSCIGIYNHMELRKEFVAIKKLQEKMKLNALFGLDKTKSILNPQMTKQETESYKKELQRLPDLYKKGRMYSIASAIGGLSSIVATVALVAFGFLTGPAIPVLISVFAFKALYFCYRAYTYHNHLQKHNAHPATA